MTREHLDWVNAQPGSTNELVLERQPQIDKPYHGNLVVPDYVNDLRRKALRAVIAAGASFLPP